MTRLGAVIAEAICHHYGRDEFLRRLAHPFWFQSFGAVMGMDWHSSGITTSVVGALKRGLAPLSGELGLHVCGDSMEPTLEDGQEIWVQMQPTLESGDIGVFYLDGNAFVKEYNRTDKGVFLISHNEKYKPIPITDFDESRIYGKVVYPR